MNEINFFKEDTDFLPEQQSRLKAWLKTLSAVKNFEIEELNYIFCSDKYLHEININYLEHDTYTDIITFDNSDEEGVIAGDIFISIDRVKENAENLATGFENELHRVIAHGLLHLLGYDDKSEELRAEMRKTEDEALLLLASVKNTA